MADDKIFDIMVKQLSSQVFHGGQFLKELPKTIRAVLGENRWQKPMWMERVDKDTGEVYTFSRFEDFVTAPPTAGVGASVKMLRDICRDDPVAIDMLDRAVQKQHGGDRTKGLNHSLGPDCEPSKASRDRSTQNLRRLREDRPDLHEQVLAKAMTVTEAAVAAGFYPPRIAINLKSPKSAAATIRNNAPPEFVAELRRLLDE